MFDQLLQQLKARAPLAPLCPAQIWKPEISRQIAAATDAALFGDESKSDEAREMRLACRAGLLLSNDDLDASHELSQQITTPTGSFWHAIMHRREGDFSNSLYWWRRTGNHPAFADVYTEAMSALLEADEVEANEFARQLEQQGNWTPEQFVDICERATGKNEETDWQRKLQLAETTALLDWCRART